jgi:hypothetical protein
LSDIIGCTKTVAQASYDTNGDVIGVTIINARRIIGRDGHVTITLPHAVQVEAKELAAALG